MLILACRVKSVIQTDKLQTRSKTTLFPPFIYFQFASGISFVLGVFVQAQLSIDSSSQRFFARLIIGASVGFVYLSALMERTQITLSIFTAGFVAAIIIVCSKLKASTEIASVAFVLTYSLAALVLSMSQLPVSAQAKCIQTGTNNFRSLIFLIGAKLLTIFCYFLPFACILWRRYVIVQPNTVTNNAISSTVVASLNHLIVLLSTRLILGTIAIFIHHKQMSQQRRNVNYLPVVYLIVVSVVAALSLIFYINDFAHLASLRATYVFGDAAAICVYVGFSLFVDVIGHRVAFDDFGAMDASTKILSLTFATFIEHLIDVIFMVTYLNDFINSKLILTSLGFVCLAICVQCAVRSPTQANNNYSDECDKQQI